MATLCRYCQAAPVLARTSGRPPVTCGAAACRQAMKRAHRQRGHTAQNARRKADRAGSLVHVCPCGQTYTASASSQRYCSQACFNAARRAMWTARYDAKAAQKTDRVEQLYQQARAARLARERATGQRTYTIESDSTYVRQDGIVVTQRGGWIQKPGAGDFDGVNGAWSTDGEAW